MVIDSVSGEINWYANVSGLHHIKILVEDGRGGSAVQEYDLEVYVPSRPNTAPELSIISPISNTYYDNETLLLVANAYDIEDGDLNNSVEWSIDGVYYSTGNNIELDLSGFEVGSHVISASVSDSGGLSAEDYVVINVEHANEAPVVDIISPVSGSYYNNETLLLIANAYDAEDGNLNDSVKWYVNYNYYATGNNIALNLSLVPLGSCTIEARVSDSEGLTAIDFVSIDVIEVPVVNHAPEIVSEPVTEATVGELYYYDVDAIDVDGDTLSYYLIEAPDGMSIDPVSGLILWVYSVTLRYLVFLRSKSLKFFIPAFSSRIIGTLIGVFLAK